uniref:Argininosuccinate synthase n=2 Tax=Corethron hystrix TaxID=216773 RepID=A0A7S1BUV7_9STRA|eukprot:CAMPEP_0113298678 /NCGR_PEP_ID=MMETSP0010_2-20120614/1024_1 /TAXON_ID=216773 ORGANISM="Corethron hystrix, Strain 308" /NCGR_SAMPLE_ID=MMETSP0010_2 /ASSEMBLY_ACC=CAM_ASM_000155 /LENGTH=419 /DNA_ID=CAMNT_0000151775 /DNA_START=78 /DNA_END=1337 /DNA_ORIENTATION=- /assembly_acc=CAM_ASM_000155
MSSKPKVVLAYSGGLDTSVILKWLSEKGFDVICFCANVGQHDEDFSAVEAKALHCGAIKCVISDLRKEFVTDYVFESIKCNALYEGRYLLGTSIARPVIAKEQIRIATEEGALYVAHGATGKGNDQVRFEMCAQALSPKISTIAPWRDPEFIESFKGRKDLLAYCEKHGIPVDAKPKANYSIDENLYHTSYESGMLEDEKVRPDESMFKMTTSPKKAPDTPEVVRIEFKAGVPVKISNLTDGETIKTDPLDIFLYCNAIAGKHGVGRIDIVENRFVGIKSRGIYETPGGTLLREGHLDLEGVCVDREVKRICETLSLEFSRLCYNGFWFAPEMDLIRHSINYSQRDVEGYVDIELYKGNVIVVGRHSDRSLYNADLASMDIEGGGEAFDYNPADSQGFIRINSVRLKTYAALRNACGNL